MLELLDFPLLKGQVSVFMPEVSANSSYIMEFAVPFGGS